MEFLGVILCTFVFYILAACVLLLFIDSDLLTFFYSKFGKNLGEAYNGKVVWITGASSGIGEGIAKELIKCDNVKIVLSARRKDELERVKKKCFEINKAAKSNSILVLPFDMTDYPAHKEAFDKVLKTFGKLDVLISNAGVSQRAPWQDIEIEVDKQLFNINVFSLLNLNRIVVKHFLEKGQGQLAVTSSIAGKLGAPSASTYSGTKFALHGYFESLRNEVGIGGKNKISITLLCPGPVTSNIGQHSLTAEAGKVVGGEANQPSRFQIFGKKMTAERCGHLSLVGIANKLEECWISHGLFVLCIYFSAYQPFLFSRTIALVGKFYKV